MNNLNKFKLIVAITTIILCIVSIILTKIGKNNNETLVNTVQSLLMITTERAFAEGQVRAINGDIRIKKVNDSTYIWIKSPWDSGMKSLTDTLKIK